MAQLITYVYIIHIHDKILILKMWKNSDLCIVQWRAETKQKKEHYYGFFVFQIKLALERLSRVLNTKLFLKLQISIRLCTYSSLIQLLLQETELKGYVCKYNTLVGRGLRGCC